MLIRGTLFLFRPFIIPSRIVRSTDLARFFFNSNKVQAMKTHQPPYLPFRRARKREKVNSTTRNANSEVDPFRVSMRSSADEINNVPWERLAVRLIGCQKERERETDWMEPPFLLLRRRHFSPLAFSFPYVRRAARTRTLFSKIVLLMKPDRRRDFTYVKLGLGKRNTGRSCRIRGRLTLVRPGYARFIFHS